MRLSISGKSEPTNENSGIMKNTNPESQEEKQRLSEEFKNLRKLIQQCDEELLYKLFERHVGKNLEPDLLELEVGRELALLEGMAALGNKEAIGSLHDIAIRICKFLSLLADIEPYTGKQAGATTELAPELADDNGQLHGDDYSDRSETGFNQIVASAMLDISRATPDELKKIHRGVYKKFGEESPDCEPFLREKGDMSMAGMFWAPLFQIAETAEMALSSSVNALISANEFLQSEGQVPTPDGVTLKSIVDKLKFNAKELQSVAEILPFKQEELQSASVHLKHFTEALRSVAELLQVDAQAPTPFKDALKSVVEKLEFNTGELESVAEILPFKQEELKSASKHLRHLTEAFQFVAKEALEPNSAAWKSAKNALLDALPDALEALPQEGEILQFAKDAYQQNLPLQKAADSGAGGQSSCKINLLAPPRNDLDFTIQRLLFARTLPSAAARLRELARDCETWPLEVPAATSGRQEKIQDTIDLIGLGNDLGIVTEKLSRGHPTELDPSSPFGFAYGLVKRIKEERDRPQEFPENKIDEFTGEPADNENLEKLFERLRWNYLSMNPFEHKWSKKARALPEPLPENVELWVDCAISLLENEVAKKILGSDSKKEKVIINNNRNLERSLRHKYLKSLNADENKKLRIEITHLQSCIIEKGLTTDGKNKLRSKIIELKSRIGEKGLTTDEENKHKIEITQLQSRIGEKGLSEDEKNKLGSEIILLQSRIIEKSLTEDEKNKYIVEIIQLLSCIREFSVDIDRKVNNKFCVLAWPETHQNYASRSKLKKALCGGMKSLFSKLNIKDRSSSTE